MNYVTILTGYGVSNEAVVSILPTGCRSILNAECNVRVNKMHKMQWLDPTPVTAVDWLIDWCVFVAETVRSYGALCKIKNF